METVLVVDDDRHIADLVVLHLEREGFRVVTAYDANEAIAAVEKHRPDLVILDVMLPGKSGFEVCQDIRRRPVSEGPQPIILLLTARVQEADAVTGLEVGADDYVRKPFGMQELVSRARALLRLARRDTATSLPSVSSKPLVQGPLSIDRSRHKVVWDGRAISLTATEFNLLHHLASNPGMVLSRDHLLRTVWGYHHDGYQRTVDSHITRVRKKLESAGASSTLIATVHGVGYRFDPPGSGSE
jgi:DNA-binding response OmpR family regulator